jgi:hypothetical protein
LLIVQGPAKGPTDQFLMHDIIDEKERRRIALDNLLRSNSCANESSPTDVPPAKERIFSPISHPKPLCVRINVAAQMIGVGKTKMYELVNAGEVDTLKIGKSTLITMTSLETLVRRHLR